MKRNRNLSIFLIILFILVTSYVAVKLFSLPTDMLRSIDITEISKLQKVEKVARPVFIWIGIDFLLVLFIIFQLSQSSLSVKSQKIVYVSKEKDAPEEKKADKAGDTQTDHQVKLLEIRRQIAALQKDAPNKFLEKAFALICAQLRGSIGVLYQADEAEEKISFRTGYAFYLPEEKTLSYQFGEGLAGQVAKSKKPNIFKNIPKDYLRIKSGLGESTPQNLLISPLIETNTRKTAGVLEIASFEPFSAEDLNFLEDISALLLEKL